MGYNAAAKLNIFPNVTQWGRLPLAFFGTSSVVDDESNKNRFVTEVGDKLLNNQRFMLAIIRTFTMTFGKCTLTYDGWSELLGITDKTIWSSLKDLESRGLIESIGQSSYKYVEGKAEEESKYEEDYVPLAYCLFESLKLKRKKKIAGKRFGLVEKIKRLSPTAILILLLLMRHNSNPNKSSKYYIAGQNQIARTLNLAPSVVNYAINELVHNDLIYRNYIKIQYNAFGQIAHYGKAMSGKGVNKYCRTALILCDELRKVKLQEKDNKSKSIFSKQITTDNDALIKKLMQSLNCKRTITDKDRRKVSQWFTWGFSQEMIESAATYANGRAYDAVRYVNGILKNWYSEGILTMDALKAQPQNKYQQNSPDKETPEITKTDIEQYYYELKYKAEQKASKLKEKLDKDAQYRRLQEEFLKIAVVRCKDEQEEEANSRRMDELSEQMSRRSMELIGKTEIIPEYQCIKCDDTGYDKRTGKACECQKNCIEFYKRIKSEQR